MTSAATARTWSAPDGASTPTSGTRTPTSSLLRPTRSGSGFGQVFSVDLATGIRNPDGSFYRAGQPLSNIQSQNQVTAGAAPLFGQWVDPRLQQPWTRQTNAGWSHELMPNTIVNVDYVRSIGGDLNFRPRINQRIAGTTIRRLAALVPTLSPNVNGHASGGQPRPQRVQRADPVRPPSAVQRTSTSRRPIRCRRARARSATPTDELNTANIQDPNNPFDDPRQFGPNLTTDARHRFTASAIWQAPWGITVAPFFLFRSGAAGLPDRRPRPEPGWRHLRHPDHGLSRDGI